MTICLMLPLIAGNLVEQRTREKISALSLWISAF